VQIEEVFILDLVLSLCLDLWGSLNTGHSPNLQIRASSVEEKIQT